MTNAIYSEKTTAGASQPAKSKGARKSAKSTKPAKKPRRSKKVERQPKAKRANRKAEVVDLMSRPGGATLVEIMEATGWQAHIVRGFVSILGCKGGEKVLEERLRGAHLPRIAK